MTDNNAQWLPIGEAARLAKVSSVQWLHKLKDKGELPSYYEKRGMVKYWYVDIASERFRKLLNRNEKDTPVVAKAGHHTIDWDEWTALCRRGEEVVKKPCSEKTLKTYRYYIEKFYEQHPNLNRESLRAAFQVYELKESRSRDYYWTKFHIYCSLMSIAKYFVYKGYESPELVKSLKLLKPIQKVKNRSVRWHDIGDIEQAAVKLQSHKTKKKSKAYSDYNAVLNEALIMFYRWTAARCSEVADLRLGDIDWREACADLDGKGGKWRPVGLNKELLGAVRAYLKIRPKTATTDHLFLADKGTPLTGDYIARRIRRAGKWVKLELSPHDIRRASISDMLIEQKLDLVTVRDIAGHVDFKTTNKYAKSTRKTVIDAMKGMK